jgi:hypothetical protein
MHDRLVSFEEFNGIVGLARVREAEAACEEFARDLVDAGGDDPN